MVPGEQMPDVENYTIRFSSRFVSLFGYEPLVCMGKSKDFSLMLPRAYVTTDGNGLQRYQIVVPIKSISLPLSGQIDMALVFVPAGPDDDSPERISSRALYDVSDENDLLPFLPIQECPDFTVSTVVDKKLARVLSGHPFHIGDFLVVRGKNYKIKDIYPDKHGHNSWSKFGENLPTPPLRERLISGVCQNFLDGSNLSLRRICFFMSHLFSLLAKRKITKIDMETWV